MERQLPNQESRISFPQTRGGVSPPPRIFFSTLVMIPPSGALSGSGRTVGKNGSNGCVLRHTLSENMRVVAYALEVRGRCIGEAEKAARQTGGARSALMSGARRTGERRRREKGCARCCVEKGQASCALEPAKRAHRPAGLGRNSASGAEAARKFVFGAANAAKTSSCC